MSETEDLVIVDHSDEMEEEPAAHRGGLDEIPPLLDERQQDDVLSPVTQFSTSERDGLTCSDDNLTPPRAVQIVSTEGTEGHFRFKFHKCELDRILAGIPSDYRVAVVSVVGAFRTGKSFLLSWFVQFLSKGKSDQKVKGPWYSQCKSLGNKGFEWKAGSERNTTGIWMWSQAFLSDTDNVATLLVDTQGMFDHETTMNLTASIFGFSTLLSSLLIYNVDKRIQEDHLQQLALFSEYARAAVGKSDSINMSSESASTPTPETASAAPFQHVEFLIRDWQHFDINEEDERCLDLVDYEAIDQSMAVYLEKVLHERQAKDLQETREQIDSCFDKVTCYGLSHPGFEVTKKRYQGEVKAIEPLFLRLLDRYCRRVFEQVQPKTIHGRTLTAAELGAFVDVYAQLFSSANKFPTAATLLAATAQANNTNAVQLALTNYRASMDRMAGPKCSTYMKPDELVQEHQRAVESSLEQFDLIATFGARSSIDEARERLVQKLLERYEVYTSLNEGRNPFSGLETYVLRIFVEVNPFETLVLLCQLYFSHLQFRTPRRGRFSIDGVELANGADL